MDRWKNRDDLFQPDKPRPNYPRTWARLHPLLRSLSELERHHLHRNALATAAWRCSWRGAPCWVRLCWPPLCASPWSTLWHRRKPKSPSCRTAVTRHTTRVHLLLRYMPVREPHGRLLRIPSGDRSSHRSLLRGVFQKRTGATSDGLFVCDCSFKMYATYLGAAMAFNAVIDGLIFLGVTPVFKDVTSAMKPGKVLSLSTLRTLEDLAFDAGCAAGRKLKRRSWRSLCSEARFSFTD